jgi:hypothetical protein
VRSICIVADTHIAVNRLKPLSVAMETQEWVLFAALSSYKIFRPTVNHINVLNSSCKVSDIIVA